MLFGTIDVGPQSYVGYDFMLVLVAVVVGYVVWWGLNRTRIGKIVLAVIHSEEVASSMGINVSRIYTMAFAAGIFLASLGGALTAPMISVQPGVSVAVVIVSFAVVIVGGLGSIPGAAIGALTYHRAGQIDLKAALIIAAGMAAGAAIGAQVATHVDALVLKDRKSTRLNSSHT